MSQSEAERLRDIAAGHGAKRLADAIEKGHQVARRYRSPGAMIPTLLADPDPDDSLTNVWLLDDKLCWRLLDGTVLRLTGTPGGSTTATNPLPADPEPSAYTKTYDATGAVCICDTHGPETGSRLDYGTDTGQHGNRRIVLMFDAPTIAADLAGAVIRSVEFSMMNTDAYDTDGVTVSFGTHELTSIPSTFIAMRRGVFVDEWPQVGRGAEWRDAPLWIGKTFRDGFTTGLTIDQPQGLPYLGEMEWASARLRIGWTV